MGQSLGKQSWYFASVIGFAVNAGLFDLLQRSVEIPRVMLSRCESIFSVELIFKRGSSVSWNFQGVQKADGREEPVRRHWDDWAVNQTQTEFFTILFKSFWHCHLISLIRFFLRGGRPMIITPESQLALLIARLPAITQDSLTHSLEPILTWTALAFV